MEKLYHGVFWPKGQRVYRSESASNPSTGITLEDQMEAKLGLAFSPVSEKIRHFVNKIKEIPGNFNRDALPAFSTLTSTIRGKAYENRKPLTAIAVAVSVLVALGPYARQAADEAIKEFVSNDNRIFRRETDVFGQNYLEGLDSRSSTPEGTTPNEQAEVDSTVVAIADYLRPTFGNDFKIFKADVPLKAQSIALSKEDKRPIGHSYYRLPILEPALRIPGIGIDYGTEVPADYWVSITGRNEKKSYWLVSTIVNRDINKLEFGFANDLDGNDPSGKWSFTYRKAGDIKPASLDGRDVFGLIDPVPVGPNSL